MISVQGKFTITAHNTIFDTEDYREGDLRWIHVLFNLMLKTVIENLFVTVQDKC